MHVKPNLIPQFYQNRKKNEFKEDYPILGQMFLRLDVILLNFTFNILAYITGYIKLPCFNLVSDKRLATWPSFFPKVSPVFPNY